MDAVYTDKILFQKRFDAMKQEHYRWLPAYKDLSDYINPTRGIFNGDRTKIGKMIDHKKLLSGYATHANRIFASGMNSGMTNKSSNWFRLTLDNLAFLEIPGVREWLDYIQDSMYAIINQSNVYDAFYSTYEELGQFGTGCFMILEDFETVIRAKSFTAGEYYLATNNKGKVCAFARDFEMTVAQMVMEFGLESCSPRIKSMVENKQLDEKIKICHLIEPNDKRDPNMQDFMNMPYRSVYWENGNQAEGFLAKRGFKRFPVVAPRWETTTTDAIYGYGCGWHAVGAIKELQVTRRDKLLVQAKVGNPPVQQDASVEGHANFLPGGVTKTSGNVPNAGVRPAYEVSDRVDIFVGAMQELKDEIDRFFFVNLFMMLMNDTTGTMTATEVAERQQEKMMMMGPALHKLDEEMLTPFLELLYGIMADNNLLPPPPEGLTGTIKTEYTSILAQAQRALGVTKIQSVVGFVGNIAPIFPEAMDNIDIDEAINLLNDMEGAPAKILRGKEDIMALRQQRAVQQKQQIAMQAAQVVGKTTKDLATSPMNTGSALDKVSQTVGANR